MAGQPVRLRRTASLQILAYLALHPAGATRSEIISAVWPHLPPTSITQRLHTTLSDLRQQLQPTITNPITRQGDRYHLDTDMIETDIRQWYAAAAAAKHAISDVARNDLSRKLLQLYRGELAAGQTWPWILHTREQIRRDALDACVILASTAPTTEAHTWLERALTIDPYNTRLQARIATAEGTVPGAALPAQHAGLSTIDHLRRSS